MPFEPLRTAIVGLGRMGRFHLGALEAVDELDVVALAEPSPGALAAAGAVRPTATRDTDVLHALAHPGLEACLIASPTPTHPQLVTAALDAGLHVLCEKPLALDADEARSLGARAADLDLVLQVGFWRRFSPPWSALKRCIAAGAIGTPLMVRLSQWDAAAPPAAFCDPAVSGGLAVDCGVHEFDLASWLTAQRITSVSAWSLPIVDVDVGAAGDVDNLVAVLELEAGSERRRHAHRAGGHGGRTHRYSNRHRRPERGEPPVTKRVVVHQDDVGMCHGANVAFLELAAAGVVTSGSVMVPCPGFGEVAAAAADDEALDLGVHLTLTAEKASYRWGPISAPAATAGMTDDSGSFWRDVKSVRRHADPQAVELELRAQVDRALAAGIDVTHLDAHMGAVLAPG